MEYFGATVNPGVPDGTRIVEISGLPSGRVPVTAATPTTAVIEVPELVMNDFDPSITHCAVLEPGPRLHRPGHVGAAARLGQPERAELSRPRRGAGSHSRFCASVPNR